MDPVSGVAGAMGIPTPVTKAACDLFGTSRDNGFGDRVLSAVIRASTYRQRLYGRASRRDSSEKYARSSPSRSLRLPGSRSTATRYSRIPSSSRPQPQ